MTLMVERTENDVLADTRQRISAALGHMNAEQLAQVEAFIHQVNPASQAAETAVPAELQHVETSSEEEAATRQFVEGELKRIPRTPLPPGTPSDVLLTHTGTFHFEPGELDAMQQAIDEAFGQVNPDDWR